MDKVGRKLIFSCIGITLGLIALFGILQSAGEELQATGQACEASASNMEDFLKTYHSYERYLGGNFVCVVTQFLYRLVQEFPAGLITWCATWCSCFPVIVAMIVEAGRSGAVGSVKFPSLLLLLGFVIGISVVFPALWVPSYIWGRSTHTVKGTVHVKRAVLARFCVLPGFLLTFLVFYLNPSSYAWTFAAGCLLGPAMAMTPLVCWTLHPPPEDKATTQMVYSVVTSYSTAGSLAFLMWAVVMVTIVLNYRWDYQLLFSDCWTNAHGYVRFMAIDAIVLYSGALTYIGYIRMSAVVETLVQTVFFGPGAALAATMATLEMERSPLITPRQQQESDDEQRKQGTKND